MAVFSYSTRTGPLQVMNGSYEELSATTGGVVTLTSTKYQVVTVPTSQGQGGTQAIQTVIAQQAVVQVTANAARFTIDGTTPTTGATGTGFEAAVGDVLILDGLEAIRKFKIIGASATATVKVVYFRL